MRKRHCGLLIAALAAGALCLPAVGQMTVTIDFESPTYAGGNLHGQDGWSITNVDGGAAVVVYDNGPGGGGSMCAELNNTSAVSPEAGSIDIDRAIADVVAGGGPLVTLQYDFKELGSSLYYCAARVPGMGSTHWYGQWCQWYGYQTPDGQFGGWGGGPNWQSPGTWHTIKWTVLYGDTGDGQAGQLLSIELDGTVEPRLLGRRPYLAPGAPQVVDQISIDLGDGFEGDYLDTIRIDNIMVTGAPLPSAVPVADAGPDLSGTPGGVYTLDASGSTDDGGIVQYRWLKGAEFDTVLYDGPNAVVDILMPGGVYDVTLEVIDTDGLHDTDTMHCSFAFPPINPLVLDFEAASGYGPGPIHTQDGWFETQSNGDADVVDTDNGPSAAGSQCLLLSSDDGTGHEYDGRIQIERGFSELIALGGGYVTYQYDFRRVEMPDYHVQQTRLWLPGANCGHWGDHWSQWEGAEKVDGTSWVTWGREWAGADQYAWHTHTWTLVYTQHDGGRGEMYSYQLDDQEPIPWYPERGSYMRDDFTPGLLDNITIWMEPMWYGDHFASFIEIDNIIIEASPLPSAFPTANADGPYNQDPGEWTGIELDGSASVDTDGSIVRYRWTMGWGGGVLYDGPEATPQVDLGPGDYELVLTVFDDTGLRDTATTTAHIGPRPPIVDEVAGPWGIVNGNIYGTNASDQVPVLVNPMDRFEIIGYADTNTLGTPDTYQPVFDAFGNLYWTETLTNVLFSYTPDLQPRWEGHYPGGGRVHLGSSWGADAGGSNVVAGLRGIYAIGGGVDDGAGHNRPHVYAFEKSNGELFWETTLEQEDWSSPGGGAILAGPKITLFQDKLYIHGLVGGPGIDLVNIFQVDASTGNLDWYSTCTVELDWDTTVASKSGGFAFVPNPFGDGKHYLYWNELSDPGAPMDGFNDMACIEVDPDPATGGAVSKWDPGMGGGQNGPMLEESHPAYSTVTGLVYTPSGQGGTYGGPHAMYAWDTTGLVRTYTVAVPEPPDGYIQHDPNRTFALDFDGRTMHATGEGTTVRSYTDNGDGTWGYVYRDYGEIGFGFRRMHGGLLQADDGHSVLITGATQNPFGWNYGEQTIAALDLSEPVDGRTTQTPLGVITLPTDVGNVWGNWGPTPGPDGTLYVQNNGPTRIWRVGVVPAELGACCFDDAHCEEMYPYQCAQAGGTYMGDGMACADVVCTGACCFTDGHCEGLSVAYCEAAGGISGGLGTDCGNAVCATSEACPGAIELAVPSVAMGDTTNATIDAVTAEGCGASADDGPDLWYTCTGTGYNMTATMCGSPVVWDSQLAVYEGPDCENLVCVDWADDSCPPEGSWGCHSDVTWASTEGQTYYIRVFGWSYQMGLFGPYALELFDDAPVGCAGDLDCDGDVDFDDINPFVLALSGEAAYLAQYPDCRWLNADCDGDLDVDFDDINPFVSRIGSTCP